MLNYEVLEESYADAENQWMRARYDMRCECNNQYKSIMMAKINGEPYDYGRIISSITHFGWESDITDDVMIETVREMIQDTIVSPFVDGEISAYYFGTIGKDDFAKKDEVSKMQLRLSRLESQIHQIVKEVLEYREDSWIHSAINLSILARYVRGQLLIRETQTVMQAYEILDPDILSIIIRKFVPECHQLV